MSARKRVARTYPPLRGRIERIERELPLTLGVISDTHLHARDAGRLPTEILELYARFQVDLIVHAGDIVDQAVIDRLESVAPVVAVGNAAIIVASADHPIPAITLAEVLATSDLPAGAINILTGSADAIMPWLATHADVNAVDLTGIAGPQLAVELERAAAGTVKRVQPPGVDLDWYSTPTLSRMRAVLETKTVWHPMGI